MAERNKGIFYMVMSSLFFAAMAAAVKLAGDLPAMEKVFFRNLVGFFVSGLIIWHSGRGFAGSDKRALFYRSLFGFLGLVSYFYAIDRLPLANAVILNQMNPFIVLVLAFLFLREKIVKMQWLAIMVAILGVFLIVKPGTGYQLLPALAGLLSAFFTAAAYTVIRHLRASDHPQIIVFYFTGFSTFATLPFMLVRGFVMPDFFQLQVLLVVGVTATIAQFFMTHAYRYGEASELSIYSYGNTIFAMFIGMLLWREFPDALGYAGVFFVFTGAYLNWRVNREGAVIAEEDKQTKA
ncbi:MAG: DMT family transporter [Clostridium sp.]|nr:DMT family transporter [Clostridium sp.]